MTQPGAPPFDPLSAAAPVLSTPLAAILAERIGQHGPIAFAEWMDACLYHPEYGYYRRDAATVGTDGDFLTSPEVHPIFGAAVAHLTAVLWERLGCPDPFRVAEIGPGTGALQEALLRWLAGHAPGCMAALRLSLVEPNSFAVVRQQARLGPLGAKIEWVGEIDELSPVQHLIAANELLDALAVDRLQFQDGEWRELRVGYRPSEGFHDVLGPRADPPLSLRDIAPRFAGGEIVEVSPLRAEMVERLAAKLDLRRSLLLLFDYGYERERLYAPWRREGTLMTMRRHVPGDHPYLHPGEQDITCHIDLSQYAAAARGAGLRPYPVVSQAEWLRMLGAAILPPVAEAGVPMNEYLAARRAVDALTDPAGLGRISVLAAAYGEPGSLPGLAEGSDA